MTCTTLYYNDKKPLQDQLYNLYYTTIKRNKILLLCGIAIKYALHCSIFVQLYNVHQMEILLVSSNYWTFKVNHNELGTYPVINSSKSHLYSHIAFSHFIWHLPSKQNYITGILLQYYLLLCLILLRHIMGMSRRKTRHLLI